jgi:hypothetical protein
MWRAFGGEVTCQQCRAKLGVKNRSVEIVGLIAAGLVAAVVSRNGASAVEDLIVYLGVGGVVAWVAWQFITPRLLSAEEQGADEQHRK